MIELSGVPGLGPRVSLDYLLPDGRVGALPTGNSIDKLHFANLEVSIVHSSALFVYLRA